MEEKKEEVRRRAYRGGRRGEKGAYSYLAGLRTVEGRRGKGGEPPMLTEREKKKKKKKHFGPVLRVLGGTNRQKKGGRKSGRRSFRGGGGGEKKDPVLASDHFDGCWRGEGGKGKGKGLLLPSLLFVLTGDRKGKRRKRRKSLLPLIEDGDKHKKGKGKPRKALPFPQSRKTLKRGGRSLPGNPLPRGKEKKRGRPLCNLLFLPQAGRWN